MKKYLSGLLAVILAVGFSAFTEADPIAQTFKFVGVPSDDEDVNNTNYSWELVEEPVACELEQNDAPCFIVLESDTDLSVDHDLIPETSRVLSSSIELNVALNIGTGTYYVNPANPTNATEVTGFEVYNQEFIEP